MKHHLKYVFLALVLSFTASSSVFLAHNPSYNPFLKPSKEIIRPLDDTNGTQSTHVAENPYTKVLAAETQGDTKPTDKEQSSEVIYDSSGENLVLNSSYEVNSGDEPKYWDITDGQQSQYSPVTEPVRSGDKSLKVTLNGKTTTLYGKTSTDTASKAPYTLSVSLNLASYACTGTKCTITLGLTDSNPQNKLHTKTFTIDSTFPTNTWARLSATFDNSQLGKLNPFIEFESDFSSGTVYLDDVKLEIGSHYTEYSQTNGLGAADGAISADKHGNLYPTKSNSGALGTTNKKWLSLDLKSAGIDKNGNLSLDGDAAIGGTADITGDLHVIGKVGIGTTAPALKLEVNGYLKNPPATSGTTENGGLRIRSSNGTGVLDFGTISGGNAWLQSTDADDLSLHYSLLLNPNGGNVGIGTTNPQGKLEIQQSSDAPAGGLRIVNTAGTDRLNLFKVGSTGYIYSGASGEMPLVLNGTGNVGIGTTNPSEILHIQSTTDADIKLDTIADGDSSFLITRHARAGTTVLQNGDNIGGITGDGYDGTNYTRGGSIYFQVDGTPGVNDMPGAIIFETTPDGSNSDLERMRITNAGNVGIGTTNPIQKLDVVGNANLSSGSAYYINNTSVLNATTLGSGVTASSLTSVGVITSGTWNATTIDVARGGTGATSLSNNYLVKGNGTSPLSSSVIYDNGTNVGVGTTNPQQLLSVFGDFAGYSGSFFNDGNADTRQGLFIQGCLDTNPTSACNFIEFRDGNGTVLGAVEGNGAGGVTNASAGSDYAELFNGNRANVERGDLLGIDTGGNVVPATVNTRLLGVYSVKPATLGNWKDGWENDNGVVPVGLLGQLPVKVSAEAGEITAGDFLTVSSKPGVAMKADKSGHTIGRALESSAKGGEIMAYISTDYYTTDDLLKSASDDVRSSVKTLSEDYTKTFEKYDEELSKTKDDVKDIKKDIQSIWDLLEVLTLNDSGLKVNKDLNVDGDIAFDSAKISGTIGAGIIKINAKDGSIIATELKADKATFDELTVKSIKIDSKDDSHKITGSGELTAGEKSVTIDTKEAKDDSKIFITPTTKTNNQTLYVSDVKDGDGFEVSVEESQSEDIKFNWWLIN